jgi:hypothetical protein
MGNTTTVNNRTARIGQRERSLEMVAPESAPAATSEMDFILSDSERTFQIETRSKSYGANKAFSRSVSSLVSLFGRIVGLLNGFGGGRIDVHRMETGRSEQPGLGKWNL